MRRNLSCLLLLLLVATLAPASASIALPSDPVWSWPADGQHIIRRPFLAPATPYSSGHRGIDVASAGHALAAADGVVHFAGVIVDRGVLSIRHDGGLLASYEPVLTTLEAGDVIERGQVIGTVEPGHCTSLCLHFGVRLHGEYLSPLNFLGGIPRSVLLPTRHPGE